MGSYWIIAISFIAVTLCRRVNAWRLHQVKDNVHVRASFARHASDNDDDVKTDQLTAMIEEIIGPREKPTTKNFILASDSTMKKIEALKHPLTHGINGVPVDIHTTNRYQLLDFLIDADNGRPHLLCTVAAEGFGKSTQQALNMLWFTEAMTEKQEPSIALEINFDDDQAHVWKGWESGDQVGAVKARILHRLLSYYLMNDPNTVNKYLSNKEDQLIKAMADNWWYISIVLSAVKRVLQVPESTRVLFCVEQINTMRYGKRFGVVLCDFYSHRNPKQLASINAFDGLRNAELISQKYPLRIQCLPPLWFHTGFDIPKSPVLPPVLQPFLDPSTRATLPKGVFEYNGVKVQALDLYRLLTSLFLLTSGHPKRVETLFHYLRRCPNMLDMNAADKKAAGKQFVHDVLTWFQEPVEQDKGKKQKQKQMQSQLQDCEQAILHIVDQWVPSSSMMNELAGDMARAFNVSDGHIASLKAVRFGFGHWIETPAGKYHTLLPLHVMQMIEEQSTTKLNAQSAALLELSRALTEYQQCNLYRKPSPNTHTVFTNVVLTSLLLFARANHVFAPADLCDSDCQFSVRLLNAPLQVKGGPKIAHWQLNNDEVFPAVKEVNGQIELDQEATTQLLSKLLQRLQTEQADGALFLSSCPIDTGADIVGLFRVRSPYHEHKKQYVLLCVQTRDDSGAEKCDQVEEVQRWLQHTHTMFPEDEKTQSHYIALPNNTTQLQAEVTPMFLRFTAQRDTVVETLLQQRKGKVNAARERHRGAGSLQSMRHWLPSAAYACEMSRKLREVFSGGAE